MARPALNPIALTVAGIAALGCVASGAPAEAATVTYDFTVDITTGNTVGKYTGNFSFELDPATNPLRPCSTNSTLLCAFANTHALTLAFNFPGRPNNAYTGADDRDGGAFPAVYFTQQNVLVGLGFIVGPSATNQSFAILGREFYQGFVDYPNTTTKANLVGAITYALRPPSGPGSGPGNDPCDRDPDSCNPVAVPEPSEIAGSAIAVGLLGGWQVWRKRQRQLP